MKYSKIARILAYPTVASLCVAAIISFQLPKLARQDKQIGKAEYLQQEKLEKSQLTLAKKLPTFGFDNLTGDWFYLQFIQYFGDGQARNQIGYSLSPEYFEVVVTHNPRLVNAYFYLASATSLYAGRPDRSVALIEQGLQLIDPKTAPKAYLLWIYKGVDELLFLGNSQAARHSYQMAAQWAENSKSPNSKQVAMRAKETAQFLATNPDSIRARIGAWTTLLSQARDDASRQLAISNIEKLGGKVRMTSDGNLQIIAPAEK